MMASLFIILLLTVALAWLGYRRGALTGFALSFVLGVMCFYHHVTSQLNIQL